MDGLDFDWLKGLPLEDIGWALAVLSVVTFAAALLVLPWILVRIPHDYLTHSRPIAVNRHPALRLLLNVVGVLVFLAGVTMLVLPGQGLLTMLAGLLLVDFPGKQRVERALLRRPGVFRAVNALRRRAKAPPLLPPHPSDADAPERGSA